MFKTPGAEPPPPPKQKPDPLGALADRFAGEFRANLVKELGVFAHAAPVDKYVAMFRESLISFAFEAKKL